VVLLQTDRGRGRYRHGYRPCGDEDARQADGEFTLLGVAYRQDGSVATRVGDTVELDFETSAQLAAFLKVPYHYSNQFSIAPGQYRFRIVAGSDDKAFGSAEKPLNIEPWGGQTLSVSGIALSVKDYPATGVAAELESSMVEGPRRLSSKGRVIVPMGGTQFQAGENGLFYFEIYEPRMVQATAGQQLKAPAMRIRILDRATGEVKNNSGPMDAGEWMQAGNSVIPVALNLPASNLPPALTRWKCVSLTTTDRMPWSAVPISM
jgi:hypothetical protein